MAVAEQVARILHEKHYRRFPGTIFWEDFRYEVTLKFTSQCQEVVFPEEWGEYLREVLMIPGARRCSFWIDRTNRRLDLLLPAQVQADQVITLEFRYVYPPKQTRIRDNLIFFKYSSEITFGTIFPSIPFAEHFQEIPRWYSQKVNVIKGQRRTYATHRLIQEIPGARGITYYHYTENLSKGEEYTIQSICRLSLVAKFWLLLGAMYGLAIGLLLLWDLVRPLAIRFIPITVIFRDVASILMLVGATITILIAIRSWFMFSVIEISEQYRISNLYLLITIATIIIGAFLSAYNVLLNEYIAWSGIIFSLIVKLIVIYLLRKR